VTPARAHWILRALDWVERQEDRPVWLAFCFACGVVIYLGATGQL
jgi:hypothetical protein